MKATEEYKEAHRDEAKAVALQTRIPVERVLDIMFKANLLTNMAFLMTDVAHGYLMDLEVELGKLHMGLSHDDRHRAKLALEKVTQVKSCMAYFYKLANHTDETDEFCVASDYIKDCLEAICNHPEVPDKEMLDRINGFSRNDCMAKGCLLRQPSVKQGREDKA